MLFSFFFLVLTMLNPLGAQECPDMTGRVILPHDKDYDDARSVSNYFYSKDSFPKAVVYCRTAEDVQNAVKWARCEGLGIRIRSGGHHHEGFSTGSDVLVIDVSEMKKMELDKEKGIAQLEPGITGGELYTALFKEGYTQVGGTCADVGISGLVLTGGMGPLARVHGLTCDSLLSFEMVDAEGNLLIATKDNEHADLFWAACGGGGGNFGIVTSLALKVYPAQNVTWFNIGWDWSQPIDKIIAAWQDFFYLKDDRRWFSHLDVWAKAFPVAQFQKQPIKAMGVFYGTPEQAKQELAPLLAVATPASQMIEEVQWRKALQLFEDSTAVFVTDKPEYKSTGSFVMEPLPKEAIQIIIETLKNSKAPLLNVLFLGLGGAVADKDPSATAYYYRGAKSLAVYSTQWLSPDLAKAQNEEVDALREKLLPYTQGDYVGNPDRKLKDYLSSYWGGNVQRLREVKKKYDPNNVFNFPQSIPPFEGKK